jgi:hypothetical protein
VTVLPGNTSHFYWAKSGDYITRCRRLGCWAWNTSIRRTI